MAHRCAGLLHSVSGARCLSGASYSRVSGYDTPTVVPDGATLHPVRWAPQRCAPTARGSSQMRCVKEAFGRECRGASPLGGRLGACLAGFSGALRCVALGDQAAWA